jgi:uncharacterized protein (TIGR02466 family)
MFPSLLFESKIDNSNLCDTLEETIISMWKKGNGSYIKENKYISWDDINLLPDFKQLCDIIVSETDDILNFLKVKRDSHYIANMWANVTCKNQSHVKHTHPNSFLSGVFYVKTPENCNPIVFSDPRSGNGVIEPDYIELNNFNCRRQLIKPNKGDILFWPSWLPHAVESPGSEEDHVRISIAFNIMFKGNTNSITQRLEY